MAFSLSIPTCMYIFYPFEAIYNGHSHTAYPTSLTPLGDRVAVKWMCSCVGDQRETVVCKKSYNFWHSKSSQRRYIHALHVHMTNDMWCSYGITIMCDAIIVRMRILSVSHVCCQWYQGILWVPRYTTIATWSLHTPGHVSLCRSGACWFVCTLTIRSAPDSYQLPRKSCSMTLPELGGTCLTRSAWCGSTH